MSGDKILPDTASLSIRFAKLTLNCRTGLQASPKRDGPAARKRSDKPVDLSCVATALRSAYNPAPSDFAEIEGYSGH